MQGFISIDGIPIFIHRYRSIANKQFPPVVQSSTSTYNSSVGRTGQDLELDSRATLLHFV